jgi:glycosyltransferase involved in cell wall biosynthesis
MKVLYFCEGFTDIRFVVGLSEICELTIAAPAWEFEVSGLANRIAQSGAQVEVHTIPGRRPAFQARSMMYLLRNLRAFDVVVSQEMVRGSLNATVAGKLLGVPVVTYLGVAPVEYYRCRRERRQIGMAEAFAGEAFIRFAMFVSGGLGTTALGMGPYLRDIAGAVSRHAEIGCYYGVDTELFKPVSAECRRILRKRHELPADRFLIFFSSRISHEKDPETVLHATAAARARGLDAMLLNLGGGYEQFLRLADDLGLPEPRQWIVGRPAVHPMKNLCDYFQAADVVIQSSLAEGAAFSTLEALSSGVPVIATDLGGMAVQLKGYAQLTPRRDAAAMANAIEWVADNPEGARAQALQGRGYVVANWRREKAFGDLATVLHNAVAGTRRGAFPRATSRRPQP